MAALFSEGDLVDVAGTTIGKGFQARAAVCFWEAGVAWTRSARVARLRQGPGRRLRAQGARQRSGGVGGDGRPARRTHARAHPASSRRTLQGGIKRWGFARGLMTHGSKSKREHGSTGPGSTPGRVFPGVKMPGHMGAVRTKIRKLEVRDAAGQGGEWRGAPGQQAGAAEWPLARRLGTRAGAGCWVWLGGRGCWAGQERRSGRREAARARETDAGGRAPCSADEARAVRRQYVCSVCRPSHAHPPLDTQVLKVDTEKGALVVKGAVPGKPGNLLEIAPAKRVGVNV